MKNHTLNPPISWACRLIVLTMPSHSVAIASVALFGALAVIPGPVQALTINGTGQGSSPGGTDTNWQVAALPSPITFTPPSDPSVTPYNAFVPTNGVGLWVGGGAPQTGVTSGGITNYWVTPNSTAAAIVSNVSVGDPNSWYNWILRQTFTVAQAGWYDFSLRGTADNRLAFFVNGSIDNSVALRPTITGGTPINLTSGSNAFGSISTYSGTVYLNAGSNTAYAVITDEGVFTGALIQQSTYNATTAPVPAPLPLFGAAAAFAASRRLRKRLAQHVNPRHQQHG